jgi:hypothetical protein
MNPLIVAEGISAGSQLLGAKKGSDAAKEAAAQQRVAEQQGRQYLQQGLEQYQQAFAPFSSGAVAGQLGQYAWNPQTRQPFGMNQPGGMTGGMSLADLYRVGSGQPMAPKAQYDYSNPGVGTTADLNKTQLSDLSTPGAVGTVMPSVTMMNFLGEKRQVQSTAVPEMQRQGWMIAQNQTPISGGVFGGGR